MSATSESKIPPVVETPAEQPEVKEEPKAKSIITTGKADHSEAPASVNMRLYSQGGADIQLTLRSGTTFDEAKGLLDVLVMVTSYGKEKYNLSVDRNAFRNTPPATQSVPASAIPSGVPSAPPVAQGNAPGITSNTFECEQLVKNVSDGKTYWKIKGAPYRKFGVVVWPEVLEDAGFAVDMLTDDLYSLEGYTAHFSLNESGQPHKVLKLVRN